MSQRMVRPGMRPQARPGSALRPAARPVARTPSRPQVPATPAAPKKPMSPLQNVLAFKRGPGGATSCTTSTNDDNWKINFNLPLTADNICQAKKDCLENAYKEQGPMACYNPDGSKKDPASFETCLKTVCNQCRKIPCAKGGKRRTRKGGVKEVKLAKMGEKSQAPKSQNKNKLSGHEVEAAASCIGGVCRGLGAILSGGKRRTRKSKAGRKNHKKTHKRHH